MKHWNPFATEGDKLHNVITHAYIPDEYVPTILNADVAGQKLYEDDVSERINWDVSLWAPAKKENNKMFMSQENNSKTPRQGCWSEGDQGLVWQTDGPVQVQQRLSTTKRPFGTTNSLWHQEPFLLRMVQSCHAWTNLSWYMVGWVGFNVPPDTV